MTMFGETRLVTLYFQQMTFHSKIPKIIHTPLQKWSIVWIILELSVNYVGAKCQLYLKFWSVENKM